MAQDISAPCRLCDSANRSDDSKPAAAIQLDVEARLDFDRLILGGPGEGSAELGPNGERQVRGSVSAIGARAIAGQVMIRGEPGRYVRISLPDHIQMAGLSGGTLRLDSIWSDAGAAPRLGSDGTLSFRFGGAIRIAGDVDGDYRGDVAIDVDYL
ncbi:MAG: DUF4402 domain-containing protein [Sphingomonas sp.]|nr:DUF4402 domain-containing protein [Sphingomonas sp.]